MSAAATRKMLALGLPGGRKMPEGLGGKMMTPEDLKSMLAEQDERMKAAGVECKIMFVRPQDEDQFLGELRAELAAMSPDLVTVGAGVRTDVEHTLLFEKVVSIIMQDAPQAKIGFDKGPMDLYNVAMRQLGE
mmetsp:Transcript_5860/g.13975  ORF Transcript_5860/g.13975 Transcript_5860/m.13975 type:complete len:133 (-) Transcript_5860:161-559(-)